MDPAKIVALIDEWNPRAPELQDSPDAAMYVDRTQHDFVQRLVFHLDRLQLDALNVEGDERLALEEAIEVCRSTLRVWDSDSRSEKRYTVRRELREANAYVCIVTPASKERPWVIWEHGAAWMSGKPLITARAGIGNSELPQLFTVRQTRSLEDPEQAALVFKALGDRGEAVDAFCERIAEEIAAITEQSSDEKPASPIRVDVRAEQGHVYLDVTNRGSRDDFIARVVNFPDHREGTLPWVLKWDSWREQRRPINAGETKRASVGILKEDPGTPGIRPAAGKPGGEYRQAKMTFDVHDKDDAHIIFQTFRNENVALKVEAEIISTLSQIPYRIWFDVNFASIEDTRVNASSRLRKNDATGRFRVPGERRGSLI